MKEILLFFLLFIALHSSAADTLSLNLRSTDSLFLVHNLLLLAQRYQINADEELIRQAKLWDNPSLTAELGMNSIKRPRFLDVNNNGETAYSVDQLIQLAGKRNKNIVLARLHADYSKASFEELMRTLKLELHNSFYALYFKSQTLAVLKEQTNILDEIVDAYKRADANGSAAHADYIRLLALQLSLKKDYLSLTSEILDNQQNIQQLLGTTQIFQPIVSTPLDYPLAINRYSEQQLTALALDSRSDVRMNKIAYKTAEADFNLQEAMAIPDLHLGATYDKLGGYVNNYIGLTLGIDFPFWNRNQGNIRSSRIKVQQSEILLHQQQNKVITEVSTAYQKVKNYEQSFNQTELEQFGRSYRDLIENIAGNFTKGNLSLLQFIDFFNSYSDNVSDLNEYYESLFTACEQLEFAVGTSLKP